MIKLQLFNNNECLIVNYINDFFSLRNDNVILFIQFFLFYLKNIGSQILNINTKYKKTKTKKD